MKLDPYNNEDLHNRWKKDPNNSHLSKANNQIIQQYIKDLEEGRNLSRHSRKGARSFIRINKTRQKVSYILELLEKNQSVDDVTKTTEDQIHKIFNGMRKGDIRKLDGGIYKATSDYVKNFKAFWHWFMRVSAKQSKAVIDITVELDSTEEELPQFNYFTEEQFNEMVKVADEDMQMVMMLMFDTGIRVTEMKNLKVSDLLNDCKELNIREETAKTFGRRIKLMLSSEAIKRYVKHMELKQDSYLVQLEVKVLNNRLNSIGKRILKVDNLSMYDFRHSSACYWYPRYKDVKAYLYRFGWKKLEMAHYYSRFLGMEDTIKEEDLMLGVTKTDLEKKLGRQDMEIESLRKENKHMMEGLEDLGNKFQDMLGKKGKVTIVKL